jgi:hypothetical protein
MLAGADKSERRRVQPGAEVATPLYAHQQEALAWMIERENSSRLPPFWGARARRGLHAREMGMRASASPLAQVRA